MFFLSFALSIAIYTIWLNAKLGILISLMFVVVTPLLKGGGAKLRGVRSWKSNKCNVDGQGNGVMFGQGKPSLYKTLWKDFLWVVAGNLLALLVVCGNLRWKDSTNVLTRVGKRNIPLMKEDTGGSWLEVGTSPTPSLDRLGTGSSEGGKQGVQRQIFNGFGTITDTQKYHVYLFEDEEGKVWRLHAKQTYHIGDQIFLSASVKLLDTSVVFDSTFIPPREAGFRDYRFNYDKRIFMKGFDGTAYEKQALLVDPNHPGAMNGKTPSVKKLGLIDRTRAGLQGYVEQVFGQNQYAGLLLGLLIGDKSLIPTEQYDTFVDSGLVHIIAVSGGNIAMVVILLSFLLKWVPLYVRNGLIILMIIFYAAICGGDSSVIRAAIMGCLTLIAIFRGREVSIRRAMKYALVGILIFNPFALVYDVGLLLSFSAIVGIVLMQSLLLKEGKGRFDEKKPQPTKNPPLSPLLRGVWKEYLTPTIGASLGTAPVLMFFMNGLNLVGVALNVIIVPLVPIITIYGFTSLFLYAIVQRGGWIWVEVLLMKIVYGLSTRGAQYAIFVQAKNVVAKYVLVVLFVGLGIWGYWVVRKKDKGERKKDG